MDRNPFLHCWVPHLCIFLRDLDTNFAHRAAGKNRNIWKM